MKRLLLAAAAIAAGFAAARLLLRQTDWAPLDDLADVQPFWLDADDAAFREFADGAG